MKSGKCCLLSSLVIIIGLGIGGFIFRDKIINEYNKYWSSFTSSLDEDTTDITYDSSEEIDTSTSKLMTTTSASTSTTSRMETTTHSTSNEEEHDYSESDNDNDDFLTIVSSTEAPSTTTTSSTVPPTTTSTTTVKSTTSIIEGSGSGYKISTKKPVDLYDDEDYDEKEGSGSIV